MSSGRGPECPDRGLALFLFLFLSLCVWLWGPAPATGQSSRLEMDLSASRIAYDTLPALNAPSLSLLGEWQLPSFFGRANGSVTAFDGAGWSAQGAVSVAGWMAPRGAGSPLRLEAGGTLGGSHHSDGFDTGLAGVEGRMHVVGRRIGAWVGASLARAKNSYDTSSVDAVVPGAGVWIQDERFRAMVSYQHTTLSGEAYRELDASFTVSRGPLDLAVYAGVREWPDDTGPFDERWVGAAAALWVSDRAALLVSGGRYGSDVLRGLPGGEFVSMGLRLTPRRSRPIPIAAVAPIVYTPEEARLGSIGFEIDGARRVEIAGDWNGWQPTALAQDVPGRWLLPEDLEPGTYRFNVRVDGERWMVPEGFPTLDDGFGGTVGLLIVAESE